MLLKTAFFLAATVVLAHALLDFQALARTLAWLRGYRSPAPRCLQEPLRVVIILPALREQRVLEDTIEYLLALALPAESTLTVAIVTTAREADEAFRHPPVSESTMATAARLANAHRQCSMRRVVHFHYPDAWGHRADQINYGIAQILADHTADRTRLYIATYDADSRPHPDTIVALSNVLGPRRRAFQQPCLFLSNLRSLGGGPIVSAYLRANAVLQTRWTLVHEIPRIRRQSERAALGKPPLYLGHTVGHGLFLRGDLIESLGGIPTGAPVEDVFLGFILSLLNEPITPMRLLEIGDSPTTVSAVLKQKYVWYFGPMDHLRYRRYFLDVYGTRASRYRVGLFTLQGLLPAVGWLGNGWLVLLVALYPLHAPSTWAACIAATALLLYGPLSYVAVLVSLRSIKDCVPRTLTLRSSDLVSVALMSLPAIIVHSIPPLISIAARVLSVVTGVAPPKPKTER